MVDFHKITCKENNSEFHIGHKQSLIDLVSEYIWPTIYLKNQVKDNSIIVDI